jgi:hypothetical protein
LSFSSPDNFQYFFSFARERESPIQKEAEVLNGAFMQGKTFLTEEMTITFLPSKH